MVLVGPSGCGKTTALRMVAGLEEISEGVDPDRRARRQPRARRATATSRWSSRATRSTRTSPSTRTSRSGCGSRRCRRTRSTARVQDAARILDLEPFLKRKPRALSGGQRQRVAMGRAIVREPPAFLMDEPLSNLDAKLRVQMRAEISRLQRDLGVTTIYVTHDQVEAMTMGDRVAVMRKGELQQVDDAAGALRPAGQPLRRRLHRLPGDEHARGARSSGGTAATSVAARRQQLALDEETVATHPALQDYEGRDVIVGIRPEDLEDAALRSRHARRPPSARNRRRCARRSARRSWCTSTVDARPALTEDVARARRGHRRGRRPAGDQGDADTTMVGRFGRPVAGTRGRRRSRSRSTRARCTSSTPRPGSGSTTRTNQQKGATA